MGRIHHVAVVIRLLLLCSSSTSIVDAIPSGRSEHIIAVNDGAGGSATRHFVVHLPSGSPTMLVLMLHGSTRHSNADKLSPVRYLEKELGNRAKLWFDRGALLVYLAAREVQDSGQFCWGVGTDNGLCTARREGAEDESFVLAVLDWVEDRIGVDAVPAYLYGHSGGGRMTWRAACNSTIAPRLAGVFPTSALLAAELRGNVASCDVSTMPPIFVTHGTTDKTTDVAFDDESVAWTAAAAKCNISTTVTGVGRDPVAELIWHTGCPGARPDFSIAYYRLREWPHKVPKIFWYGAALDFWMHSLGPGMPGYEAVASTSAAKQPRRLTAYHIFCVIISATFSVHTMA